MQPAQWPCGEPRRLRLFTCTSRLTVSSFIKAQPKPLVLQVRPLRAHLANFTALPEFHFEARVAFALLCSFMQVDSRTMGGILQITPGSVAPVLMDLENRRLKDPTKLGWVARHPHRFGARMLYMHTD